MLETAPDHHPVSAASETGLVGARSRRDRGGIGAGSGQDPGRIAAESGQVGCRKLSAGLRRAGERPSWRACSAEMGGQTPPHTPESPVSTAPTPSRAREQDPRCGWSFRIPKGRAPAIGYNYAPSKVPRGHHETSKRGFAAGGLVVL